MLSPADRRWLVVAPFNALGLNRLTTSYPHAGTLIDRGRPEDMEGTFRKMVDNEESLGTLALDEVSALWGE